MILFLFPVLITVALCTWAQVPLSFQTREWETSISTGFASSRSTSTLPEPFSNMNNDKYESFLVEGNKRVIQLLNNDLVEKNAALLWKQSNKINYRISNGNSFILRNGELFSSSQLQRREQAEEYEDEYSICELFSGCIPIKCTFRHKSSSSSPSSSVGQEHRRIIVNSPTPRMKNTPIKIYKQLEGRVTIQEDVTLENLQKCLQSIDGSFEEIERAMRTDCMTQFPLVVFALWLSP